MRIFRFILIIFFCVFLLLAGIAAYFAYESWQYRNPALATIIIPKGSSVRSIAGLLEETRVIKDRHVFEIYVRFTGDADKLKAGEYEFEDGLDMDGTIKKIVDGKVKLYQFTVPEGYNTADVCRVLTQKKLMDTKKCAALAQDVVLLKDASAAVSLEGYLFPETYSYDSQMTPELIFKGMVDMFYKKTGEERVRLLRDKGLSLHAAVTLASVVEKETGQAVERPLIAGVFFNRIKIGMPLQSDPTTIYGIRNFNGNLTRRDLETDTPYNTYTRTGLPAGPICNPGLAAIDAVISPAVTDALYFVAKGDGSHYFSKSLDEHNRAVRYYQLKEGDPP